MARGGFRPGAGRRKNKQSFRKIKQRKRQAGKHKLKLLVESFDADPERQLTILNGLSISHDVWLLYFTYRERFDKGLKSYQTFGSVLDKWKKREFKVLATSLNTWLDRMIVVSDETLYRKAREIIIEDGLDYLKRMWDPKNNEEWFKHNILSGRKQPYKKFRPLYEWVAAEVKQFGRVRVEDVRIQAGYVVGENFQTYKKFSKLSKKIRDLLCLESLQLRGKSGIWRKRISRTQN